MLITPKNFKYIYTRIYKINIYKQITFYMLFNFKIYQTNSADKIYLEDIFFRASLKCSFSAILRKASL